MAGQRPQQCFMTPLLVGTDGSQKMSKSLGNYIGVAEPPSEIYGKVMSIPDSLIMDYFELLTDIPDSELEEFRQQLARDTFNPMELKKRLAKELVTQLYDQKAATESEKNFTRVFQKREVPEEIEEYRISFEGLAPPSSFDTFAFDTTPPGGFPPGHIDISRLLAETHLAKSRSEASRLIEQGAVEIEGEKISSNIAHVKSGSIIKVGRRRFARVINTDRER